MDFLEALKKGPLFFDGAMGTMLQKAGLRAGMPGEVLNLKDPETVLNVQRAYAAAGCDIIQMNTFGANRIKVAKSGLVPASQAADEAAACSILSTDPPALLMALAAGSISSIYRVYFEREVYPALKHLCP